MLLFFVTENLVNQNIYVNSLFKIFLVSKITILTLRCSKCCLVFKCERNVVIITIGVAIFFLNSHVKAFDAHA